MDCSKWKAKFVKVAKKRIPISTWIWEYSREDVISDIIAGVTMSLTMIPQSMAYAALAGFDPQYGLNSAFMGCFIYVLFGTVKEVIIGPSSLMSLLTFEYTQHLNVDFAILLCFTSGIVQFLITILQLGFLVSFISTPVISGFTTATTIIIVISQMKGLLGLYFKSFGFIDNLRRLGENLIKLRFGDSILGICCICCLLSLRKLKDVKISKKVRGYNVLRNLFWFLATGRNALVIFLSGCLGYYYKSAGLEVPFITTKSIESGIPSWSFPPIKTQVGNKTYNLQEMVIELGSGNLVIPIVSIFANIAIAKAFARGTIDATQEMMTLSLSNIFGSFFQSLPTAGAFTRSAVISASGVRSPVANLYCGTLTLLALQFLTPYFHYIPRSTLSAVLISAVIFLIDWEIVVPLWRASKVDFLTLVVSFVASLCLGVEVGLLFGVVVGLAVLVQKWARPEVSTEINKNSLGGYVILRPELGLYFPSVDYLTSLIMKLAQKESCDHGESLPIVIDCSKIKGSDYSAAKTFNALSNNFSKSGKQLLFLDVPSESKEKWKIAGCKEQYFCTTQNLNQVLFGSSYSASLPLLYPGKHDAKLEETETLTKNDVSTENE
ncbi:sodium-independent sulfate anion transporter-like [Cimex lectularius]|uniref:STAS domain-containing protein n=1 Tax=Cimex lectularius TaxID=79782 RepID=A0A8I6RC80_CIMLE|nr:sodium-independent sulfate anion transporter-like [Cimex lectularius]